MASPIRKAAADNRVNFGSLDMYVAGGGLPEGDYSLFFTLQMYQATNKAGVSQGPPRLGVMITAHSLTDPAHQGDNAPTQFYSMGSNADKSFAPNTEDGGKSLVPIPGGPASTFNESTNWAVFLKNMYDSGLPNGIFTNDLTVLDGTWAHIKQVPEPESRKGFKSATAEGAPDDRGPKTIAVVTEIKEGGAPWEGGGGLPTAAQTTGAKAAAGSKKSGTQQAAGVGAANVGKPNAAPQQVDNDEDIKTAALNAVSGVFEVEKNAPGMLKLVLKSTVGAALRATVGDAVAEAVLQAYWASDDALNSLLGEIGYIVKGPKVVPAG
jgi:hypothetical protein